MFKKMIAIIAVLVLSIGLVTAAQTAPAVNTTAITAPPVATAPADAWVMTLGGVGATKTSGTAATGFGFDISLGKQGKLIFPLEAGVRQNFTYAASDNVQLATKLYVDWTVLQYKKLDVFVGASGGALYGNTPLNWSLGPEAGARVWIKKDVAIVGRVEYPFSVTGNNVRNDDTLKYFLGLAVKF
jgi:hypothetical protein